MVEAYARSHNIPAVILRPFNTFGPRQSERAIIPTIIRQILDHNCKQIELGNLTTTRDFLFVDDKFNCVWSESVPLCSFV